MSNVIKNKILVFVARFKRLFQKWDCIFLLNSMFFSSGPHIKTEVDLQILIKTNICMY